MSESYFKRRIISALTREGESSPKTLGELVEELEMSRTTVLKWLKTLRGQGLVRGEPLIRGRGRPKLLYHPTQPLMDSVNLPGKGSLEVLLVSFRRLQKACRYRKGGRCKEALNVCRASICPLRLRGTRF